MYKHINQQLIKHRSRQVDVDPLHGLAGAASTLYFGFSLKNWIEHRSQTWCWGLSTPSSDQFGTGYKPNLWPSRIDFFKRRERFKARRWVWSTLVYRSWSFLSKKRSPKSA